MSLPMITPAQSRAARGLIAWNQQDLANEAGVGVVTVQQLEAGTSQPRRATLDVIRRAFERAGVEFIDENGGGPGVRLRKRQGPKHPRSKLRVMGRLVAKTDWAVPTNELASSRERGQHEPRLVGLNNDSGGCFSRQQLLEIRSCFCQTNP